MDDKRVLNTYATTVHHSVELPYCPITILIIYKNYYQKYSYPSWPPRWKYSQILKILKIHHNLPLDMIDIILNDFKKTLDSGA